MASLKAWLQTVIIPPLIALVLYIGAIYFLVPLYRRRQLYSQYLPLALTPSDEPGIVSRTRGRIQSSLQAFIEERLWHRRSSSGDINFGDEELEEDMHPQQLESISDEHTDTHGRRLSRDLEAGFRDDSDDERAGDESRRRLSISRS